MLIFVFIRGGLVDKQGCSSSNHVSPTLLHLKRFEFEKLQKMEKSVQIQDSAPVTLEKPSSE